MHPLSAKNTRRHRSEYSRARRLVSTNLLLPPHSQALRRNVLRCSRASACLDLSLATQRFDELSLVVLVELLAPTVLRLGDVFHGIGAQTELSEFCVDDLGELRDNTQSEPLTRVAYERPLEAEHERVNDHLLHRGFALLSERVVRELPQVHATT